MTDRITELAMRANFWQPLGLPSDWDDGDYVASAEELQRFAELVRAEALDEAAKKCEQYAMEVGASSDVTLYSHQYANAGTHCAEAIRSLK